MQEDKNWYEMKEVKLFPQSSMLVLHHQQSNKIFLHLVSRNRYSPYDHALELVTAVPVSEFSPYFMLYPEQVQEGLTAEMINVIGKASRYGKKYRKAENNPFPSAFKRLARKLIRVYQYSTNGEFLTEVFVGKLYGMLRQIWIHFQVYFRSGNSSKVLRAKLQRSQPIQSFGYEC